jgi:hypothetical protein
MVLSSVGILWTLATSGCSLPPALSDCRDARCRSAWVAAEWAVDPETAKSAVKAVVDPVVQLSLVLELTEAHPGEVGELCEVLPPGDGRVRCLSIDARPHLSNPKQASDKGAVAAWRRVFGDLPQVELPDAWRGVDPAPVDCTPGQTAAACRTEAAQLAARQGGSGHARAICVGLEVGTWRDECIFQAAEAMAEAPDGRHREAQRFADAASMCLAAGPFAHRCLTHLQREVEQLATPANRIHSRAWAQLSTLIAGMEQGLADFPEAHRDWMLQRVWSGAIHQSMGKADRISGGLLGFLPPDKHVHVWDAAVWRLMELEEPRLVREPRTLNGWVTRVRVHLARMPQGRGIMMEREARKVADLWDPGVDEERGIPQVPYLGGSRRAHHSDPALDAQISVLEAGAQLLSGRHLEALLMEGTQSPDALVRWTAVRLWAKKLPKRLPPMLGQDPSPMVRVRWAQHGN